MRCEMRRLLVVTVLSVLVLGGRAPAVQATPADDPLLPAWFAWRSSGIEAPPRPPEASEHDEILLTGKDAGRHIELGDGQVLAISLEANPSTGYLWEALEYDEGVLRQVGEPAFTPESDAAGAPGSQVLRFEALEKGQTALRLANVRPWEDAEPEKVFSVLVLVR